MEQDLIQSFNKTHSATQTGVVSEDGANYPSVHQSLGRELKKEVVIFLLKAHQEGQRLYNIWKRTVKNRVSTKNNTYRGRL